MGRAGSPRVAVVPVGAAAALAALGWISFLVAYRHTHELAARRLFPAGAAYLDLTGYISRFGVFRQRAFFEAADAALHRSRFAYPPAAAFCYEFIYATHHMKFVYNVVTALWWMLLLAFTGVALWRATNSRKQVFGMIANIVLLSYPALFLLERANIEIFVWMALITGSILYVKERWHVAAVCLGVAAALKLYPVFLLGLFVGRRVRWSALITGVLTAAMVTVGSIALSAPGFFGFGARGYLEGITGFQTKYSGSMTAGPVAFDHSLFSWVKLAAAQAGKPSESLTGPYYLVCGSLAAFAFLVWVRQRPLVNRITFLTVAMVLLPPVSFEYTLVHLYLPLVVLLLLLLQTAEETTPVRRSAMIALGCLLFLLLPVDLLGPLAAYAGPIQVAPLLLLMVAAAGEAWEDKDENTRRDVGASGGAWFGGAAV